MGKKLKKVRLTPTAFIRRHNLNQLPMEAQPIRNPKNNQLPLSRNAKTNCLLRITRVIRLPRKFLSKLCKCFWSGYPIKSFPCIILLIIALPLDAVQHLPLLLDRIDDSLNSILQTLVIIIFSISRLRPVSKRL